MKKMSEAERRLRELTTFVCKFLNAMDDEMKMHESPERGKRIAQFCNQLEIENDRARFFGLGIDYRKDKKPRAALASAKKE